MVFQEKSGTRLDINDLARVIAQLSRPTSNELLTVKNAGFQSVEDWRLERNRWSTILRDSTELRDIFAKSYADHMMNELSPLVKTPTVSSQEKSPESWSKKYSDDFDVNATCEVKPRVSPVLPFEGKTAEPDKPKRMTMRLRQVTGTADVPLGLGKPVTPFVSGESLETDDDEVTNFLPKKV